MIEGVTAKKVDKDLDLRKNDKKIYKKENLC